MIADKNDYYGFYGDTYYEDSGEKIDFLIHKMEFHQL